MSFALLVELSHKVPKGRVGVLATTGSTALSDPWVSWALLVQFGDKVPEGSILVSVHVCVLVVVSVVRAVRLGA